MRGKDVENLKLLYSLYKVDDKSKKTLENEYMKPICEKYRAFIKEQGLELVKAVETTDPATNEPYGIKELISKSQIIQSLLQILSEHLDIVRNCFEANTSFEL